MKTKIHQIYDINNTVTRRNTSWQNLPLKTLKTQLMRVLRTLEEHPDGLTTRQISKYSKLERTNVTRTLATYRTLFNDEKEIYDIKHRSHPTAYRLNKKSIKNYIKSRLHKKNGEIAS